MGISAGVIIDLTGITIETNPTPITASSLIATKQIELTDTLICAGVSNLAGRKNLTIQNNSLNAIYVGNAIAVDKSTGILLASGSSLELSFNPLVNTDIYGIAIGVPASISVVEV
jgi:hypothetical protein